MTLLETESYLSPFLPSNSLLLLETWNTLHFTASVSASASASRLQRARPCAESRDLSLCLTRPKVSIQSGPVLSSSIRTKHTVAKVGKEGLRRWVHHFAPRILRNNDANCYFVVSRDDTHLNDDTQTATATSTTTTTALEIYPQAIDLDDRCEAQEVRHGHPVRHLRHPAFRFEHRGKRVESATQEARASPV